MVYKHLEDVPFGEEHPIIHLLRNEIATYHRWNVGSAENRMIDYKGRIVQLGSFILRFFHFEDTEDEFHKLADGLHVRCTSRIVNGWDYSMIWSKHCLVESPQVHYRLPCSVSRLKRRFKHHTLSAAGQTPSRRRHRSSPTPPRSLSRSASQVAHVSM